MGAIFNVFPVTSLPLILYNIIAFSSGSGVATRALIKRDFVTFQMPSTEFVDSNLRHVSLAFSLGHIFIFVSMILIFIELLKSTSTGTAAIFNHALSMLVFIVALLELVLLPGCATAAFFVITITLLLDVVAGVVVTVIAARRDVEFAS